MSFIKAVFRGVADSLFPGTWKPCQSGYTTENNVSPSPINHYLLANPQGAGAPQDPLPLPTWRDADGLNLVGDTI